MLDQNEDGSHAVTLHRIRCPECDVYPTTSGMLRWRRDRGVSVSIEFDGIDTLDGTAFWALPKRASPGVGRLVETDFAEPDWLAETDDGTRVALYGADFTTSSIRTTGTAGHALTFRLEGSVTFAVIDIPFSRMLAFECSAEEDYRMFFSGHAARPSHECNEVSFFGVDGSVMTTMRSAVRLADSPRVSLINANAFIKCTPGGWLGFGTPPVGADCEIGAFAEQSFVSFLNGAKVPFHWADRKIEGSMVRRTYFGWARAKPGQGAKVHHQPLPLLDGVESLTFGEEVLDCLPSFFQCFVERFRLFDFTAALHPLWTALDQDSILQDRLALASVSLERTAAYWNSCRKVVLEGRPASEDSVWKQKKLRKSLRQLLSGTLDDHLTGETHHERCLDRITQALSHSLGRFVCSNSCSQLPQSEREELRAVVQYKIDRITDPPNSSKLKAPFLDLQIELRSEDAEAIKKRNDALHGRQNSGSELQALDKETEYFDRLRILITKFVLRLCQYEGPFIDFASRPSSGNFDVVRLNKRQVAKDGS